MSYIVIGRVIQNNIIVGLKLIDTQYYNYYWLEKKNFSLFFNSNDVLNCKLRSGKVYSKLSWLKMQDLAEFSNQGYMTGVGVYSDIYLVATILSQSEDFVGVKICGAICGAITDEFSDEVERHAYMYYQEIREMSTDIQRIAKFTGIDEKIIAEIKNYVFMEYHELETGYRRFDPCFSMAVSWQRLLLGRGLSHDITLLKHEYKELNLVKQGLTCSQAHEIAQKKYDYNKEVKEYHAKSNKY